MNTNISTAQRKILSDIPTVFSSFYMFELVIFCRLSINLIHNTLEFIYQAYFTIRSVEPVFEFQSDKLYTLYFNDFGLK